MRKKLLKNWGLKLSSLVLAFILWFLVVQIEDPQDSKTFNNIRVKLTNTEMFEQQGKVYEILEDTDVVRVTVYAPRSIVGQINASDIIAEADVSKLTDINTIAIKYYTENAEVDIIEGNRDAVHLNVEDKKSKWVRLVSNTVGEVADGFMITGTSLDQTNIEITGPESVVSQVEYAAVDMGVTGATTSISANIDIHLFDSEGNEVAQDNIKKNVNYAYMTVEVLATKEVPVTVEFMGEAAEGYMATGVAESNVTSVLLAGKPSVLENISVITVPGERMDITGATGNLVDVINLREYLPDNVKLAEKDFNGKITATVYVEPIVTKELQIPAGNIVFVNEPEDYTAEKPADIETYPLSISGLTRLAHIMSMYQSSAVTVGYSLATRLQMAEKEPSVFFIIFALVTIAILVLPLFLANSKAARAMRSVPGTVVTLKSIVRLSGSSMPRLPRTYSPSVFSR